MRITSEDGLMTALRSHFNGETQFGPGGHEQTLLSVPVLSSPLVQMSKIAQMLRADQHGIHTMV